MRIRRSLIDLDDLNADELTYIFDRTAAFEKAKPERTLAGIACANMFFEQSTRTFASFNLAELRLGADVVNLSPKDLSLATKGETLEDTAITLGAMGFSVLVVRHPEAGFPQRVAMAFDGHVVNAGDGPHAHPTQALLDVYTLIEEFGDLAGRTVAIVGDVLHSRVAHSTIRGLHRLKADVVLVGPESFLPASYSTGGVTVERDFDAVLPRVDAVILLRIQRERFEHMPLTDDEYVASYRLDAKRLKNVREHAVVMHPGPYNRGMELDDSVLEFAGWRYAKQVRHGVGIRMAVLDFLVNGRS
ncbi:MAG: aspartate carbamoyltransferase catalytic subunit [Candidatus Eremiobacteraeota bacterium]|nr:aspartate carbamoyltransferase catalytic subunit [Candidatus Eremiobacteraeota bacterium]MBV8283308.1 aspartate carbamoyltransferase catalytic subunit [Candidatus Eremiobacteraeota bacterium]MBV8584159.1 aspartate carbamoyltransferase catalytic subunit [Candidatus Eremiobacteraeota bacterium]MBV8655994.1 aspartate carbamoyltransferase catalytic subunit [Candidatus Eremiobacteraeota bacterium]